MSKPAVGRAHAPLNVWELIHVASGSLSTMYPYEQKPPACIMYARSTLTTHSGTNNLFYQSCESTETRRNPTCTSHQLHSTSPPHWGNTAAERRTPVSVLPHYCCATSKSRMQNPPDHRLSPAMHLSTFGRASRTELVCSEIVVAPPRPGYQPSCEGERISRLRYGTLVCRYGL